MSKIEELMTALRQSTDADVVAAMERLVREGQDHELCRVNTLAFATKSSLDEERVIAAFLHASQLGLFELSWNVLCPGCGSVLGSNATLKSVHKDPYHCALCAAGYEPTLDDLVEVTFTVSPKSSAALACTKSRRAGLTMLARDGRWACAAPGPWHFSQPTFHSVTVLVSML